MEFWQWLISILHTSFLARKKDFMFIIKKQPEEMTVKAVRAAYQITLVPVK